ncbi:MAG: polynucleotide adenylyltransferase PcnB [Proteobacteria bacterium]|nr:polynucleotide adenylyltransferase PcnB [Pseudomonadota bacterium]MCL2308530.1 polynucleotide adenylyltransferase PcnB [Pseudomonadota bacterium]
MIRQFISRLLPQRFKKAPRIYDATQHNIRADAIDEAALIVVRRLHSAGFQAFIVGGAVRDLMLGRRPKDFDIATDATPEEIKPLFRRAFIIGRRFRLVHVHTGHDVIEVSTFRSSQTDEDATDEHGRLLSDNVYGTQAQDALRRDFTINALYFDPETEEIWDYVGGVNDVRAHRLKLIGPPVTRYREDPVRMLRAVRLAAKLGLTLAPTSEAPLIKLASLMRNIPPARLFEETQKLLLSGNAQETVAQVRRYQLLPSFDALLDTPTAERFAGIALAHTDARLKIGKTVSPAYLFAALLWPALIRERDARLEAGMKPAPAFLAAMDTTLEEHAKMLAVPRRFQGIIREIWGLQPRFEQRQGQRPFRLLEQPRFRAAYDFLCMRAENREVLRELSTWWEKFQKADDDTRKAMLATAPKPEAGSGSRPRRRRKKSQSANVATSA